MRVRWHIKERITALLESGGRNELVGWYVAGDWALCKLNYFRIHSKTTLLKPLKRNANITANLPSMEMGIYHIWFIGNIYR